MGMTAIVNTKLLTVEEFLNLYPDDEPYELLEGRILEVPPPKPAHGTVDSRFNAQLRLFVDAHQLGDVLTNTSLQLSASTLIAPDVAFVSRAKPATVKDADEYFEFASDLAVEVVSPSNSANDIETKVGLYLAAGTSLVWVAYPVLKKVVVHLPDRTSRTFSVGDSLDGGTILRGLSIPVATLFPPEQPKEQTQ
jgi:Uma2 family endonuclease